jgi:hypothetical protein
MGAGNVNVQIDCAWPSAESVAAAPGHWHVLMSESMSESMSKFGPSRRRLARRRATVTGPDHATGTGSAGSLAGSTEESESLPVSVADSEP